MISLFEFNPSPEALREANEYWQSQEHAEAQQRIAGGPRVQGVLDVLHIIQLDEEAQPTKGTPQ